MGKYHQLCLALIVIKKENNLYLKALMTILQH